MTEMMFWELVEAAGKDAGGDAHAQATSLVENLRNMPVAEILSYGEWFERMMDRANSGLTDGAFQLIGTANPIPETCSLL